MAKTLHMTLKREWFVKILSGEKTEEYRAIKPHWTKKLAKQYDTITFRNGYDSDSPVMVVQYFGYSIKHIDLPGMVSGEVFALKLGRVLDAKRCERFSQAQLSLM